MTSLRLTSHVQESIVNHALTEAPNEACGLVAQQADDATHSATTFYPIRNIDESPVAFTFDPHEHIAAENDADDRGLQICGVMHSHPTSAAWPSPTDIAAISRFDPNGNWVNVIVSLVHEEPNVRAFRILDGRIVELAIEVDNNIGTTRLRR